MNQKKTKVAVIGVGSLGQHHARVYSEMDDVDLVAVVDASAERAKEIASKFNCDHLTELSGLRGKIDAASVVVPTFAHHAVSKALLEQGVHLLLEKPMTTTLAEADDLIAISKRTGAMLQVGHIEQFNTGVKMLKEHLVDPRFVECHRVSPFIGRGTDVDVILDLMIHDIDIILSLMPSKLSEIRAAGTSVMTSMIDIANVRLAFENGEVANITASRVSLEKLRKIRIFQPDAYFSLDYAHQEMRVFRRIFQPDGTPKITTEKVSTEKEEPLKGELASFIDSIRTDEIPTVSGEDGRKALDVALQIVDLIKHGQARAT
ncbi:MAG: Gfo/Idh/MocA family protein [Nitrospiria bacterium]